MSNLHALLRHIGTGQPNPTARLREIVTGKIERGEAVAIVEDPVPLEWQVLWDMMDARPLDWIRTTEQMYWNQLEVLPPRRQTRTAFLVGEARSHDDNGKAIYAAFKEEGGRHYARHLTLAQFDELFKE